MVPPPLAAPLSLDCSAGWRVRPGYRPVPDRKPSGVGSIETAAGLAWFAICRTVWHGFITERTLIYLIIIGGCAGLYSVPAWRRRYYSRLFRFGICGGRMGQITGNAPVKPCALFCGVGGITAFMVQNTL